MSNTSISSGRKTPEAIGTSPPVVNQVMRTCIARHTTPTAPKIGGRDFIESSIFESSTDSPEARAKFSGVAHSPRANIAALSRSPNLSTAASSLSFDNDDLWEFGVNGKWRGNVDCYTTFCRETEHVAHTQQSNLLECGFFLPYRAPSRQITGASFIRVHDRSMTRA